MGDLVLMRALHAFRDCAGRLLLAGAKFKAPAALVAELVRAGKAVVVDDSESAGCELRRPARGRRIVGRFGPAGDF